MDSSGWGWTLAEVEDREKGEVTFLVRWRQIPAEARRSDWPLALHITWENRFSTREGFPVEREMQAMADFELRLGEAVEHDGLSVMSLSVTGEGTRVLLFHTRDVDEFSKRLHEMPQEEARYPITIKKVDDPTWSGFDGVFEHFGMEVPKPTKSFWKRLFG